MKSRKLSFLFAVSFLFLVIGWSAMVPQVLANERKISTPLENGKITTFKEFNGKGYNIGDDYFLANYTNDTIPFWKNLAKESNRVHLEQIGFTSGLPAPYDDGAPRPMYMAIVTSPDNWKNIEKYKKIAKQLALAEGLTDDAARDLASKGKAIVWVDAALHATEICSTQSMIQMVYRLASQNDAETLRILEDVIYLAVLSNPDGFDLVANWYMNDHVTGLPIPDSAKTTRSTSNMPVLYQKYCEHDNNRDYDMVTMPEATALSRVSYMEWYPQIVYNQHQSGPSGAVLFSGALRDPLNYNVDSLQLSLMENVSSAISNRFIVEGKPGSTSRSGASYSLWYDGGLRSTASFHNMIGIITEITGSATPTSIAFAPTKLIPTNDYPFPIMPTGTGNWHMFQCVDYLISATLAQLDYASTNREDVLFNIYKMGMNSIKKGSKDTQTWNPRNIATFMALPSAQRTYAKLQSMTQKDARGYIIPSDQPDFLTAIKLVNNLLRSNTTVFRATQDFTVGGKNYPSGSFIVKNDQAFRPHAMDAFEPLWHPDDIKCVGQAPTAPYDMAGYTMAFLMNVKFDSIYEGFDGPFKQVKLSEWDGAKWADQMKPPAGVAISSGVAGYLLSHAVNDSFIAVNRLMKNGAEVYWLKDERVINGKTYPAGTMYIPSTPSVLPLLQGLATEKGLNFEATASKPAGAAFKLQPMRIGLADVYGGNSTEGWTEYMLSQFEFPIQMVYPLELNAGNLAAKYDVLIFEDGMMPATTTSTTPPTPPNPALYATRFQNRIGSISAQTTVPKIIQFMKDGGTVLTIGSATRLAYYPALNLPIKNHLVDSNGAALPSTVYYVPGSVLEARLDTSLLINYGMPATVNVYFDSSPVFDVTRTGVTGTGISDIAWYDSTTPLRSGWGWGQAVLNKGVAAIQAQVGDGLLYMFGPLVDFRAQPHGNYKWLFNGIYIGGLTAVTL